MSTAAELAEAAGKGDRDRVIALLTGMDDAARQAVRRPLKAALGGVPTDDGNVRVCVALASLGCVTAPAETAKALVTMWRRRWFMNWPVPQLEILAGRDPAWRTDVARRVAAAVPVRRPAEWVFTGHDNGDLYRMARALEWTAGAAPSTGDGYAVEWAMARWNRYPERTLAELAGERRDYDTPPVDLFRADPHTGTLLPRLFALPGCGAFLLRRDDHRQDLVALTVTGELDRAGLIDACISGLVRGGRRPEVRGFWALLDDADLTVDELAERAQDWVMLAGRGDQAVAMRAIRMLRRLLDAGRLDTGVLAEATYVVLSRPEGTLVRAHLALVAEALRRAPAGAGELLPGVAAAFGHEDSAMQERAWKLAARYLPTVDGTVRAQLIDALPGLATDLRERAAAALGERPPVAETEPELPPVSSPRRTPPPPGGPDEVAEELAAVFAARRPSPPDRERAVDGLIRQAYRDRAALAGALAPVVRRQGWMPPGLAQLVRAVLGEITAGEVPAAAKDMADRSDHRRCIPCLCDYLLETRWYEAARQLLTEPVPFLLATPGWSTGALDAEVLLERLTEYARLGLRAGPADLDQALLRARLPEPPESARLSAAAAALGTADGARLARWLDTGGLHAGHDPAAVAALPALRADFTYAFRNLDGVLDADRHWEWAWESGSMSAWVAVVPVFREYLAAQLQREDRLLNLHDFFDGLPLLVEADGPAGPRLNAFLACSLIMSGEERPSVVDGLLQLAARGELDERWCGELLGRWIEPHGFTPILADTARSGAYRIVWDLLHAALPGVLARPRGPRRPRGLSAVLTLAADCASRVGATGAVPGLDELADTRPSSPAVKQAQRLRRTLTANAATPSR